MGEKPVYMLEAGTLRRGVDWSRIYRSEWGPTKESWFWGHIDLYLNPKCYTGKVNF